MSTAPRTAPVTVPTTTTPTKPSTPTVRSTSPVSSTPDATLPIVIDLASVIRVRTPTVRVDNPDGSLNASGTPNKIDLAGGYESWEGGSARFTQGLFKDVGIRLKKASSFRVDNSATTNGLYLNEAGLAQKQNISIRGLTLKGADLKINYLTNHPTITGSSTKLSNGVYKTWTGRVQVTADGLQAGTLPLSLVSPKPGSPALVGSYNFLTKVLDAQISGITFNDGRLNVQGGGSIKVSQLSTNSSATRVDVLGQASVSLLKQNVVDALVGQLSLRLENNVIQGFRVEVQKSDKLKLNGPLVVTLIRDPRTNKIASGSVALKDGVTLGNTGIGLAGSLSFVRGTPTNPETGLLKGTLSINNSKLTSLSYGDFSLTPRSGTVDFAVMNTGTSGSPDIDFKMKNLTTDLTLFGKTVSLSGDLDLRYVNGKPQFVSGALTLLNDVTFSAKDANGNPLSLTLKGTTANSTTPTRISLGESIWDRTNRDNEYLDLVTGKPALKFSGTVAFEASGYNLPLTIKTLEFDPSQTDPSYRWYWEAGVGTALMRQTDPVASPAQPNLQAAPSPAPTPSTLVASTLAGASPGLGRVPAGVGPMLNRQSNRAQSPTSQLLSGMTPTSIL